MDSINKTILDKYQVRKSKKEKEKFRNFLKNELQKRGISVDEDKIGSTVNVVIGDPRTAKLFVTAHYDTCAVLPISNMLFPNSVFWFCVSQLFLVGIMFVATILFDFFMMLLFKFGSYWQLYFLAILFHMFFGVANKHTANDNTSGVITVLETLLNLSEERRQDVCFVLFDKEELGLFGSRAFARKYKIKDQVVYNFDCVSDGDDLYLFPRKKLKKDKDYLSKIDSVLKQEGQKKMFIQRGFGYYQSDNLSFPKAFGICALNKKFGTEFMGRIHTSRDVIFDERNIELYKEFMLDIIKLEEEEQLKYQ